MFVNDVMSEPGYIDNMLVFIITYTYSVSIQMTGVIDVPGNTTNEMVIIMFAL